MPNGLALLKSDVDRLTKLIRWIKQVLQVGEKRVPSVLRPQFEEAWPEVADELDSAEGAINSIQSERSTRWRDLVAHGLTSVQLTLKLAVRDWLFKNGKWDDILDYIDALLDSLEIKAAGEFKHTILAVTRGSTDPTPIPDPAMTP